MSEETKPAGFVSIDMETSGGEKQDPIQVSAVVYQGEPLEEVLTYNWLMRPTERMVPAAVAVHGISEKAAARYPDPADALVEVRGVVQAYAVDHLFVGWNIRDADIPWLDNALGRAGMPTVAYRHRVLDGRDLAMKLFKVDEVGNHKLDTIFVHLFPDRVEELVERRATHDALDDCRLAYETIKGMVGFMRERGDKVSLSALYTYLDTPQLVEVWPFGKPKGQPIEHVMRTNPGLVRWFFGMAEMVEKYDDLAFTIREIQKRWRQDGRGK